MLFFCMWNEWFIYTWPPKPKCITLGTNKQNDPFVISQSDSLDLCFLCPQFRLYWIWSLVSTGSGGHSLWSIVSVSQPWNYTAWSLWFLIQVAPESEKKFIILVGIIEPDYCEQLWLLLHNIAIEQHDQNPKASLETS